MHRCLDIVDSRSVVCKAYACHQCSGTCGLFSKFCAKLQLINITRYLSKLKVKHSKRGILCSENGLRSDPSKVHEHLQV